MFSKILDFIFPPVCSICKTFVSHNGFLCSDCWNKIDVIRKPKCLRCGYPFPVDINCECPECLIKKNYFNQLLSFCVYNDIVKDIILRLKYSSDFSNNKFIYNSMISLLGDLKIKPDIIIPMPLSYKRLWKRGYNQSVLLAKPIAKHLNVKMDLFSIKRLHRKFMGNLTYKERLKNVKGVFIIKNNKNIKDKNLLIIDDVFTTGASINELSYVLKKYGAKNVSAITFCRTVKSI